MDTTIKEKAKKIIMIIKRIKGDRELQEDLEELKKESDTNNE